MRKGMDMIKEERDRLFAQNGWSKNDVRLLLKYIEELEASRDSRQLSAVPSGKESNDALNDYVGFIASIPEIQDKKSGWRECYNWMIEELKRRGIAG